MSNEANDITLNPTYPISDASGLALTPYDFTITNKCDEAIDYQIALETISFTGSGTIEDPYKIKELNS